MSSFSGNNVVLEVEDMAVGYGGKTLAGNISFRVMVGEHILLCGANGTGKSTLLRTLAGFRKPLAGRCAAYGRIVMVPARIPKVAGFTVEEFVATSCYDSTDWLGRVPARIRNKVREALDTLGIGSLGGRDISTLSDGEFQKAATAAALVRDAAVILLDEPTAFLDVDSRESIFETLEKLDSAVIFSSHDIEAAARHCSRVFGLADGAFIDSTDAGQVFRKCFRSCF